MSRFFMVQCVQIHDLHYITLLLDSSDALIYRQSVSIYRFDVSNHIVSATSMSIL